MKFAVAAFLSILLIAATSPTVSAESFNGRFGFAVDVSHERYDEIDISTNGSGMDFVFKEDPRVVASFYGNWHVLDSFASYAMHSIEEGARILDVAYEPDFFLIIYELDGVTHKDIVRMYRERIIYNAYFKAPSEKFADFLPEFEQIEAGWKIGIPTSLNGLE